MTLGVVWAQYGPYHFARFSALQSLAGATRVCAVEIASQTRDYQWLRSVPPVDLTTLCPDCAVEQLPFLRVFLRARQVFAHLGINVCMLPSYSPSQSLAVLLAAKSLGLRTVMMNETHAGTARAAGLAAGVKRRLVKLFDSALVGGSPHRNYFASLGMPPDKIFIGYDSVDNDFFARKAEEFRSRQSEVGRQYDLPEHYFLSLGRFIAKKNLATLILAFRKVLDSSRICQTHLVLVGSGEEEAALRSLCRELYLPTYDKTTAGKEIDNRKRSTEPPGVHFYGFRQIEENPLFYALADAFILPSLWEEWGLVVNEAMASGLPVVVSETVGCAEDLLKPGSPRVPINLSADQSARLTRLAGRIRQNGFVFNPNSVESLADVLIFLEEDSMIRQYMGKASGELVREFSCENFARNALLAAQAAFGPRANHEGSPAHPKVAVPQTD